MAVTRVTRVIAIIHGQVGKNMLTRLLLLVVAYIPYSAVAAVTMDGIEFSSLPGDKIEIRMHFDAMPPLPTGYTIEQPARIALDLTGVSSGLVSKYHQLGSGNARSVTVVEASERTRVIVAMTELMPYSTRVDGDTLVPSSRSNGQPGASEHGAHAAIFTGSEPASSGSSVGRFSN